MSYHYLNPKVKLKPRIHHSSHNFQSTHEELKKNSVSFDLGYKMNMNSILSSLFVLHTIGSE